MIILKYDKDNIITNVYCATNLDNFKNILNDNLYKVFENTNAYTGLNIYAINEDGSIKPLSELIELGLVVLKEDEVLEGNIIRKLTEYELKEKFPERYPEEQSKFDLYNERLSSHNQLLYKLRLDFIDAEIVNDTKLKEELRTQIIDLKKEISELESQ